MALRDDLTKEIELRLGGQMVDVELDPEHYELSMDKSFEKYRQRSENAVEEAFVKLELVKEQAEYTLDSDVIEVKDIYKKCEEFEHSGVNVIRKPGPMKHGKTVIAFIEDPDGYKIELIQK